MSNANRIRPVVFRRGLRNYWNETGEITVEWERDTKIGDPFRLRVRLSDADGKNIGLDMVEVSVTKDLKFAVDGVNARYDEAQQALNTAVNLLDRKMAERWVKVGEIRHGKESKLIEMRHALNMAVLSVVEEQINEQDEEEGY